MVRHIYIVKCTMYNYTYPPTTTLPLPSHHRHLSPCSHYIHNHKCIAHCTLHIYVDDDSCNSSANIFGKWYERNLLSKWIFSCTRKSFQSFRFIRCCISFNTSSFGNRMDCVREMQNCNHSHSQSGRLASCIHLYALQIIALLASISWKSKISFWWIVRWMETDV